MFSFINECLMTVDILVPRCCAASFNRLLSSDVHRIIIVSSCFWPRVAMFILLCCCYWIKTNNAWTYRQPSRLNAKRLCICFLKLSWQKVTSSLVQKLAPNERAEICMLPNLATKIGDRILSPTCKDCDQKWSQMFSTPLWRSGIRTFSVIKSDHSFPVQGGGVRQS